MLTQAHILGACNRAQGLYVRRHDRVVRAVCTYVHRNRPDLEVVSFGAKRPPLTSKQFPLRIFGNSSQAQLGEILSWNSQPDLMFIDHDRRKVEILEVGITNWSKIPAQTRNKPARYEKLQKAILKGRTYSCSLHGLVLGSLGEVPPHAICMLAKIARTTPNKAAKPLQKISTQLSKDALYLLSVCRSG